jgi:nicotinamidase-related amidase
MFEGDVEQKLWPAHCRQYSPGALLHPKLKMHDDHTKTLIVKKGTDANIDSYSAFFDNNKTNRTILNYELSKIGITDLYICGVATDFCVGMHIGFLFLIPFLFSRNILGATASDGLDLNYRVSVIQDACRGVNSLGIQMTKRKLIEKGALMINSNEVRGMVECSDRRIQLGYATIVNNNSAQISKSLSEK